VEQLDTRVPLSGLGRKLLISCNQASANSFRQSQGKDNLAGDVQSNGNLPGAPRSRCGFNLLNEGVITLMPDEADMRDFVGAD
jgi:hypothetical protein